MLQNQFCSYCSCCRCCCCSKSFARHNGVWQAMEKPSASGMSRQDVEGKGARAKPAVAGVWQLDLESLLQIPEATQRQHVAQNSAKTTPTTMSTPTCQCQRPPLRPGQHTLILPLPLARPLPLQFLIQGSGAGGAAEGNAGAAP